MPALSSEGRVLNKMHGIFLTDFFHEWNDENAFSSGLPPVMQLKR